MLLPLNLFQDLEDLGTRDVDVADPPRWNPAELGESVL